MKFLFLTKKNPQVDEMTLKKQYANIQYRDFETHVTAQSREAFQQCQFRKHCYHLTSQWISSQKNCWDTMDSQGIHWVYNSWAFVNAKNASQVGTKMSECWPETILNSHLQVDFAAFSANWNMWFHILTKIFHINNLKYKTIVETKLI